jgi:DNA-binding transcriptional LysR family regulator
VTTDANVDLDEIEAFLALADELHFGRTAERLHLSQSRVSKLVAAFEDRVGAQLVERTTRRVRLSPLGQHLRDQLAPAYGALLDAYDQARNDARSPEGVLRLGFTVTTEGEQLNRLAAAFETLHPECRLELHEVYVFDPWAPLRAGEVDVMLYWGIAGAPDLVVGPVIERQKRLVLLAADDPLAGRESLQLEDLAGRELPRVPDTFPGDLWDVMQPPQTPSGVPIPRDVPIATMSEIYTGVARGRFVHFTMASRAAQLGRSDVVMVPVRDMPTLPLALVWRRDAFTGRVRALAEVAQTLTSENGRTSKTSRSGKRR